MLLALGLSLVFSVMGLINFAYGMQLIWAAYTLFWLDAIGLPYPVSLAGTVIGAVALSMLMARFAFLPFVGRGPATLLLASFALAMVMQAVAIAVFGESPRVVPRPTVLIQSLDLGLVRVSVLQFVSVGLAVLVLVCLDGLINRTRFGIEIRAAAEDANMARHMGVRPARVLLLVFAVTGLIAAIVAVVWFARLGTVTPRADLNPTLKAFIAVVLGGLGTARGAVIGGLVLGMTESLLSATLGSEILSYQRAIAFALVIILLLLRPQGIAGRVREEST